ncbi:uncharacterized protein LOC118648602 [Monomorium pharaonis]|uniref:uncharacterized protein LOC118645603 n=1 Tax=Monomorium pharaonis TaxID=307658 RepID=UPI00174745C6|nr:uncharacterized protein LOC118645603 [Monomorium pharaonis]XP_036150407.1 uncharacterized protein LOC118648191 [Monomorium pharaonis]XP_036150817.1 uncharacterized protein LOC118648602 [Monomorium pharaonis]
MEQGKNRNGIEKTGTERVQNGNGTKKNRIRTEKEQKRNRMEQKKTRTERVQNGNGTEKNGIRTGKEQKRNRTEQKKTGTERVQNGNGTEKNRNGTGTERVRNRKEREQNRERTETEQKKQRKNRNGTEMEQKKTGTEQTKNGNGIEKTGTIGMRSMKPLKSNISSERRRLVEELHAPARRNFQRRHVIVRGYDDLWQADIVEMIPYSRINRGYHYILTVIDVLSKHAWAIPLKSKGGSETADAIVEIIRESARCPKNLQTDKGKEFYNADVQKILKKHDINHYSTYSVMKASVVERFNRTLKNDMWKKFTLNGNYKWIDLLPDLVSNYNSRKHRTIGMRPVDVTPAVAERLLNTVYSSIKIAGRAKFKVGDSVRVSKFKTVFEKGYTPNWTTEVFKIIKVQHTNPVTYLLEDYRGTSIVGAFYEHELHRATHPDVYLVEKVLRRKGDKVYVKWLGFDGSHNSWIHKDNVI